MPSKTCSRCREVKPLTSFNRNKTRPDGYHGQCRECMRRARDPDKVRAAAARFKENNPEYSKQYGKKWRTENKDRIRRKDEAYRNENGDAIRERSRLYYLNNREVILEKTSQYSKNNPDVYARARLKRRALKANAVTGEHVPSAAELAAFYGRSCLVPGCSNSKPTVDHVIPLSRGGLHASDNVQPLCQSHNSSKHTKSTDYRDGLLYAIGGDEDSSNSV